MRRNLHFGTETIDAALKQQGLTNAQAIAALGVDARTWWRWKKAGAFPLERVTDVVLLLDLPKPADLPSDISPVGWAVLAELEEVRQRLETVHELQETVQRIEALLRGVEEKAHTA